MPFPFRLLLGGLLFASCFEPRLHGAEACDVLVYGGTPGGIAAARAAARDGARVVLVEPTQHVGGLVTSGLSHTDFRTYEGLTGSFLEFAKEVEAYYQQKYGAESAQVKTCRHGTHAEPHVNERVFEQLLAKSGVKVHRGLFLREVSTRTPEKGKRTISTVGFSSETGKKAEFTARIFIDATYEGDLLAKAGVKYRVGREGKDEYGESLAPEKGDHQLQGYNFRVIMTRDPDQRVAVTKPDGYRREDFTGVLSLLADGRIQSIFGYPKACIFKSHIPFLPNGKYDINDVSAGPVRLSMPGENGAWPDGDAAERAKVFASHRQYHLGLLWFLQNDEAVPEKFRAEARAWGWCKGEFTDNGHLPWQLYVREARRMVGECIFTEGHTDQAKGDARSVFQPDSIAMGDYGPNCHGTAHEGPRFGGRHTGEFYKRVAPYQIPYGVLVPREVDNLLVPVACSSSHVGFCALRLEPIWMSLGQAAGVACRVALMENQKIPALAPRRVQTLLHAEGAATLYVSDVPPGSPLFAAVQWLGARGGLHGLAQPGKEPGERGKQIESQYYQAFPGHAFQPDQRLDSALRERWIALLPEAVRPGARRELSGESITRGEAVRRLFQLDKK